ncbi:unnamed protein product [Dicrocoelium dendriticum]|nr:unnamed protein product [Dicrocoelium dendriticum]
MDRAPQAYETTYETRAEVVETTTVVNVSFVKSLGGILNYVKSFSVASCLFVSPLFYLFYLFNIIRRLRGPWVIIEFSVLVISVVFWFIAFIVSAAMHSYDGGAIASAVFSAIAMGVYIAELVTRFRVTRQANGFRITMTGVATTTTASAYPHVTAVPATAIHTEGHYPNEGHAGFKGSYSVGERTDAYAMP